MFAKVLLFVGLALTAIQVAYAGCPNGGVGLGISGQCMAGNPTAGNGGCVYHGFMAKSGTCNSDTTKYTVEDDSQMCGGGWSDGASVTCVNKVPVSVRPPGWGVHKCVKQAITCGSWAYGYTSISYCCYAV